MKPQVIAIVTALTLTLGAAAAEARQVVANIPATIELVPCYDVVPPKVTAGDDSEKSAELRLIELRLKQESFETLKQSTDKGAMLQQLRKEVSEGTANSRHRI